MLRMGFGGCLVSVKGVYADRPLRCEWMNVKGGYDEARAGGRVGPVVDASVKRREEALVRGEDRQ